MTKFQIIILSIFGAFIALGLLGLSLYRGGESNMATVPITIWGTLPSQLVSSYIDSVNIDQPEPFRISYIEIPYLSFTDTFVRALARREGPDAILVPQDLLFQNEDKILSIPFEVYPERDFRNRFIEHAELYITPTGIQALPLFVDPLVMYWNRDSYTNAGIATYPVYWDEFTTISTRLTEKDVNSNIRRTGTALGEFRNINHAREIIGTLFMQAGNPITRRASTGFESTISDATYYGQTEAAINFYTSFSNPSSPSYTWNRSLPQAKEYFLSGNLATYFGFASEISDLRTKNPNLNFDIAPIPQARSRTSTQKRMAYGTLYGLSVVNSSANPTATYGILRTLTSDAYTTRLVQSAYLPPVARAIIARGTTDPYMSIFFDSALISRSWLDPSIVGTSGIFQSMIESIVSGRENFREALDRGDDLIEQLSERR